jgi:hypothetical protein
VSILAAVARRRSENRSEGQRLRKMLQYEGLLWSAGSRYVAGVDESRDEPACRPSRRRCRRAGASHREIAILIYGAEDVAADWGVGLRQRMQRHYGRGAALAAGGYRDFLR